jgi:hypothetical protein
MSRHSPFRLPARAALSLAAAMAAASAQQAPDAAASSAPISRAEQAVFMDPHLQNLQPPVRLQYRFRRSGSQARDSAFDDEVSLDLKPRADGRCCAAQGRFLSGARAMALPDLEDARSNPVTLFYLEREVRELQRRTGGQAAHFRRRIRLALADASVVPVTIRHDGRELQAQRVSIAPYLDDPQRARFERFAATRYEFTLSPQVPGGVVSIRTVLPAAAEAAAGSASAPGPDPVPLLEETLILQPSPRS